jgi:hypothetical protein
VQDKVVMCRKGRQLTAKSKNLVRNWVERWTQERNIAQDDFDIEPGQPLEVEIDQDVD